jgi:hypothetical protein
MGKSKEPLDAVKEGRPFAGVHILATAMMCSTGASADELELARRILERDPARDAPRESESIAGAFNRHMDAAIDSVNGSAGESTRAMRRARLARDLDQADLLLIDRSTLAGLIATSAEIHAELLRLQGELARVDGEDLGAELADAECSNPHCAELDSCTACGKGNALLRRYLVPGVPPALNGDRLWTDGNGNLFTGERGTIKINTRPGGLTYDAIDDRGYIKPGVALAAAYVAAGGSAHHELEDDDFITVHGGPIGGSFADAAAGGLGVSIVDGSGVTHVPIGDFLESDERAGAGVDHRVND